MSFFQETISEKSSTQNSLYSTSSQSMTTPPLSSTPASAPISVSPLGPKKILSSTAAEFVPQTPPNLKHYSSGSGNFGRFPSIVDRQHNCCVGVPSGGSMLPLNTSSHCNFPSNTSHNPVFLRKQQIMQEQQLLQRQQQELAAATNIKQQLVLSAAAAANHPQDEISISLQKIATLNAFKGNETPPSSDEVMQDFATNGYTVDELNRYQQYQAASNRQMLANSNAFANGGQRYNNFDYNMNRPNSAMNWLYNQQLQENINAYNEILLGQSFLKMQLLQTAAAANAAASINFDYNSQNIRPPTKRNFFKKEPQVAIRRCVFCENNNEPEDVVKSHSVRDSKNRVLCPKLRIYVCPICGASGDEAHTVKYCPLKPVVTMEETLKADSNRFNKANFAQKHNQMQV